MKPRGYTKGAWSGERQAKDGEAGFEACPVSITVLNLLYI